MGLWLLCHTHTHTESESGRERERERDLCALAEYLLGEVVVDQSGFAAQVGRVIHLHTTTTHVVADLWLVCMTHLYTKHFVAFVYGLFVLF